MVLATLLTCESLLFGSLAATVSMSASSTLGRRSPISPRVLAFAAAGVVTILAAGALLAWVAVFVDGAWPEGFASGAAVLCLAIGIVVQPLTAWALVASVAKAGA